MKQEIVIATALLPVLASGLAVAHPDGDHSHGFIDGMLHTLSSTDHLFIACVAGVLLAAGVAVVRKRVQRSAARRLMASSENPDTPASHQTP